MQLVSFQRFGEDMPREIAVKMLIGSGPCLGTHQLRSLAFVVIKLDANATA